MDCRGVRSAVCSVAFGVFGGGCALRVGVSVSVCNVTDLAFCRNSAKYSISCTIRTNERTMNENLYSVEQLDDYLVFWRQRNIMLETL